MFRRRGNVASDTLATPDEDNNRVVCLRLHRSDIPKGERIALAAPGRVLRVGTSALGR